MTFNTDQHNSILHLINHCGSYQSKESLLIICDPETKLLGEAFYKVAITISKNVKLLVTNLATRHGEEPTEEVRQVMLESDLIMSLRKFSLAHSNARSAATAKGARFLSLPEYSFDLLSDPAVLVDYRAQAPIVRKISQAFTLGNIVRVQSTGGTDISLNIQGRKGNCCPGMVVGAGELGSPPDIEANISPLEDQSNGIIVVDGSVTCPEIGLLTTPIILEVKNGLIVKIKSQEQKYVSILETILGPSGSKRRVLAECGIGLNPQAKLTGIMLTDEGAIGCFHFGFGSNHTVGGINQVDFHLDFVFRGGTLEIDSKKIFQDGVLLEF